MADAHAGQMSTVELVSFCQESSPICGIYLEGAYDGILLTAKYTGTQPVCAPREPSAAQLREYFLTTSMMVGAGHDADPAIKMVYLAFTVAMPCK